MSDRDAFTNLVGHLGKARAEGLKLSRLSLDKLNTDSTGARSSGSVKPPASHELRSQALSAAGTTQNGLRFGSPSNIRSAAGSQSTVQWKSLLAHAASGGLASAFSGGGGLLSTVSGIGGLVSSIVGLFGGGHKTIAPLSLFTPDIAQRQSLTVSGSSQHSVQASAVRTGVYGTEMAAASTSQLDHQPYQFQSAQIAQAVKHALLNSSDLNDVIAEI